MHQRRGGIYREKREGTKKESAVSGKGWAIISNYLT